MSWRPAAASVGWFLEACLALGLAVRRRVAVLADGKVQGVGSMRELALEDTPAIQKFFSGPRGRSAQEQQGSPGTSAVEMGRTP